MPRSILSPAGVAQPVHAVERERTVVSPPRPFDTAQKQIAVDAKLILGFAHEELQDATVNFRANETKFLACINALSGADYLSVAGTKICSLDRPALMPLGQRLIDDSAKLQATAERDSLAHEDSSRWNYDSVLNLTTALGDALEGISALEAALAPSK